MKNGFTEHGAITSAVMVRDADDKAKCFEFVNFEKTEDANEVVKTLNGKEIDGKELCWKMVHEDRRSNI